MKHDDETPRPRWWRNEPYVTPLQGLLIILIGAEIVSQALGYGSVLGRLF